MTKRTKLIVALVGGLALVVTGWWALVPRIGTATEAEVRAHVAPELLLPLPHPEGGVQRYEAAHQAVRELFGEWQRAQPRKSVTSNAALDLQDPRVQRVVDILEAGPLDRSGETLNPRASFIEFARGLAAAALAAAGRGDWERVRRQMEAAYLLLDRLTASDVVIDNSYYTLAVETIVDKAVLQLAARRDLPAALAERWSALLAVDRHSPEQVRQFLRGEFQLRALRQMRGFLVDESSGERPWVDAGTYDPIETVALMSDKFVEAGRNAALPVSGWSSVATDRISQLGSAVEPKAGGVVSQIVQAASYRIRMNTSRNTLGRVLASYGNWSMAGTGNKRSLMARIVEARSRRDQLAAALAVVRFRQRTARDPHDFDELIATGLLQAAPLDHAKEQPLAFDLKALFEWPAAALPPARGRG